MGAPVWSLRIRSPLWPQSVNGIEVKLIETHPPDGCAEHWGGCLRKQLASPLEGLLICPAGEVKKSRENRNGVEIFRYPAPPEWSGMIGYALEFSYSAELTAEDCALYASGNNAAALAGCIERLVDSPDRRNQMRAASSGSSTRWLGSISRAN